MSKEYLDSNRMTQVAILCHDIEETAKAYAEFLGVSIPPIVQTDGSEKAQTEYLGKPSTATAKLCFFDIADGVQLELIEPDSQPSTWRAHLDEYGECVHHIAFGIKDTAGKIDNLAKKGMPLLQRGEYEGGRYAYFDTMKTLKVLVETLEND